MNKVRIDYIRPAGYRETLHVTMSSVYLYPWQVDKVLAHMDSRDVVSVTDIPWCGWVNDWTDSGDRGAAQVDHERTCKVCPPSI